MVEQEAVNFKVLGSNPSGGARMLDQLYISIYRSTSSKTLGEIVNGICIKEDPKPLFCELPDDLKLRSASSTGTAPHYSLISLPSIGPMGSVSK